MHKVSKYSKRLTKVGVDGSYSLYEYKPTISKPLVVNFEMLRTICRLRFLYECLKGGYKVYYLSNGDTLVGHCVVNPGGRRLSISTKNDIVLGPYYISPEYRGCGYAKILVRMTLMYCTYKYQSAYDWIHDDNIASIKTSLACGFIQEGHKLNVVGITRKLVINDNGDNIIYRYSRI